MPEISDANATGPIVWVLRPTELENALEVIRTAYEVVIDLETTGLDPHSYTGAPSNGGVAARVSLASMTLPQRSSFGFWDGRTPVTYVIPLSHPDSPFSGTWRATLRQIFETIVKFKRPVNNQNLKFDAEYEFALTGVDITHLIKWDTVVSSHMMDETRSTRLKERVPEDFGIPPWNDFKLDYPGASEQVPLIELGEYAARDTWWTWRLAQEHKAQMFIDGGGYPEPLFDNIPETPEDYMTARFGPLAQWVAMPSVAAMTKIEQNGMTLDVEWCRRRLVEEKRRAVEGLDKMAARYGMGSDLQFGGRARASAHSTALWFKEYTRRAVDAGDLRVLSTTKTLQPQWNKAVLNKLDRQGFTAATDVLQARGGAKLSEFLSSWLGSVSRDGKIHANYNVGKVSTGRLSSNNPNMQQITKSLRPAFIPRPGYVIADFDFSQLELRMAAFIANCIPMREAFARGEDLHRLLGKHIVADKNAKDNRRAELVQLYARDRDEFDRQRREANKTGVMISIPSSVELSMFADWAPRDGNWETVEITPKDRQGAKSANFGLLYLQSPFGFRNYAESVYGVLLSEEEAVEFHQAFFDTWVGMHEWHERVKAELMRNGYVTSPLGRVRRLKDVWSGIPSLEEGAYRQAVNSPVQGTGSDLMMVAAADIQGLLPGTEPVKDVFLVASVHDSVVAELPADNWLEPALEIKNRMETAVRWFKKLGVDFDVPIVADFSVGTRWGWDDVSDPEGFAADHPELAQAA